MTSAQLGLAILGASLLAVCAWLVLAPLRGGPRLRAGIAAAGVLLALAAATYLAVGAPGAVDAPAVPADPAESLAQQVTEQLARQPDDAAGWRMLGGVRSMQGRYADAASAFARARSLSGDTDVGALVGFAEARVLEDPSRLAEVAPLFARALELAPDNQKALWYGGHAAKAAGDAARAAVLWRQLLQQELPPTLRNAILAQLGEEGAAPAPAPAVAPAGGAVLLEVEVALAPALAPQATPGAPLFVFVRAPGIPAPVLVKRVAAPRFPQLVTFTESDRLGDAVELGEGFAVGARLSRKGDAGRGSGDLEGSAPLAPGSRAKVTLDSVVP